MIHRRNRRRTDGTPDPRHQLPVDDLALVAGRWAPKADYPSNQYLAAVYGSRSIESLFVHGADRIVCPFPQAPRLKNVPGPKSLFSYELISSPARLTFVDPRQLHGSQSWILRQHVTYYLGDRWELTGIPSAEDTAANRFPTVVKDDDGRLVIVAGHHRAAAALIKGEQLLCRLISKKDPLGIRVNKAVAFTPRILWGTTSGLTHVRADTAAEVIRIVSQDSRVLCASRDEAIRAALWFHPTLDAAHFGLSEGTELPRAIEGFMPGQFSAFQPILNVAGQYQLCTDCGGLTADRCHFHSAPDVCRCMPAPAGYDHEKLMPCVLCQSCRMVVVSGHYRLRTVVCGRCRLMTNGVNRALGLLVFPQGIHSMVNGGGMLTTGPQRSPDQLAAIEAFTASLGTMVSSIGRWGDWSRSLLIDRLRALGFGPGGLIPVETYHAACMTAGLTAEAGFHELIERAATEMPPYAGELRAARNDILKGAS